MASARKSSTPASRAMDCAVSRLSPVIITVRMPIFRSSAKRSAMPGLTTSLRWMTPSTRPDSATSNGVPPSAEISSAAASDSAGTVPPCSTTQRGHRGDGALADGPVAGRRSTGVGAGRSIPLIRVLAENSMTVPSRPAALRPVPVDLVPGPAELDDRTALRCFVGQAGRQRRRRQLVGVDPRRGDQPGRLPVAVGDGAGLVQQQGGDVTGGLDRPAAHRQHIALHQPVHPGHADGRDQRADGGRDQADQQGDQHDDRLR